MASERRKALRRPALLPAPRPAPVFCLCASVKSAEVGAAQRTGSPICHNQTPRSASFRRFTSRRRLKRWTNRASTWALTSTTLTRTSSGTWRVASTRACSTNSGRKRCPTKGTCSKFPFGRLQHASFITTCGAIRQLAHATIVCCQFDSAEACWRCALVDRTRRNFSLVVHYAIIMYFNELLNMPARYFSINQRTPRYVRSRANRCVIILLHLNFHAFPLQQSRY